MPELSTPAWLLGLLLVPLVYLLHSFRAEGRVLRVPALFLWREPATAAAAGPRTGPPDPAWRRRALLVALIALALAGPAWIGPSAPAVAVWLDDGPALFAREADGTIRLEAASAQLARALREAGARQVTLYALHRPGARLELSAWDAETLYAALRDWLPGAGPGPLVPPPGSGVAERWLVGSGADARVREALARTPFQRAIPIGEGTENLALVRLAVRPSARAPERLEGLMAVVNAGREAARRTLELRLAGVPMTRWELEVAPGERRDLSFALPAEAGGRLEAQLLPAQADALPLDDALGLDLAAVAALPFAVEGPCPAALGAFLRAHPGLRPAAPGDSQLSIRCGARPPPDTRPALWLVAGAAGGPLREAPVWSAPLAEAGAPRLKPEWVHPIAVPEGAAGKAILSAAGRPLILELPPRPPSPAGGGGSIGPASNRKRSLQRDPSLPDRVTIALLFALDQPELAARPELPTLLSLLVDRLAGRELLLPAAAAARDPADAVVAPGPLPAPTAPLAAAQAQALDAAPWALAAALLLALYDLYRRFRPAIAPWA